MVASGVGQFSINVKSNLKDFYGDLTKAQKTMKDLTSAKNRLEIDSSNLDKLRDKGQRISAEIKELTQQKREIKLGTRQVENAKEELKNLDLSISSLRRQKLAIEADIQPIRTANVELHKVNSEIAKINSERVSVDFSKVAGGIDSVTSKIVNMTKAFAAVSFAGLASGVGVLKDAVNEASDLEQNIGGVQKLFGENASKKVIDDSAKAYKEAGISQNEYLEQSTTFSASLIKALEQGQTKTSDSSSQKSDLEKKKAEIEKQIKQNSYNSSEAGLNTPDSKAKKQVLNKYKQNALDLKKQKDKIDEQIANLPGKTTEQVNKLSQEDAQKQAADYANQAIVDMSDNANVFGTNIELIQNAYQGFSKNNFTMLDNLKLGFAGSQQGAMDLINTYGGLDHKVTDISEVTMPLMIKSIHNAQEAMKISGTTTKEAAKTYEGSLNAMKSAWKDFLATGDATGLAETVPVYFDNLDKKLKELTPKIIEGIKTLVKELPPKIKPVIKDIQNILTQSLDEIFGKGFTKNFTDGMKPFTNIIKTIFDTLSKSSNGKKPDLSWVGSVIPNLLKLVIGLKGLSLVMKGLDFAKGFGFKLPSFSGIGKGAKEMKEIGVNDLKDLGLKMLTIAGISANIYFAAKALQEVENVGDLGGLQPKMLAIAEAVVGMGVLVYAAGKIGESDPALIMSGLMAVAGIAGVIYLTAKALQQVGDIDADFGSMQSKIGQIALSITEIGVLALAVGALMNTGVGAVVLASGLVAIIGIAGTIFLVAKALEQVAQADLDQEKINNNIKVITDSLSAIRGMNEDSSLGDIVNEIAGLLKNLVSIGILAEMIVIANELKKLGDVELNYDKISGNISTIKKLVKEASSGSLIDAIKGFLTGGIKAEDLSNANEIFKQMIKIAESLEKLQEKNLNKETITNEINIIKGAVESISSFATGDIVNNLNGMANALDRIVQQLTEKFPPEFYGLGKVLGKKTSEGFKNTLNFNNAVSRKLSEVSTSNASSIGDRVARAINDSVARNLNIGNKISDSIIMALSKDYTTNIKANIVRDSSSMFNGLPATVMASGGLQTNPNGAILQDSPEKPIIGNGEYVIPKKIVDTLGVPFFDKLRSGNISRTFAGLAQSVSNTTSNVVNNVYNNQAQHVSVYTQGNQDIMLNANRRFRGI